MVLRLDRLTIRVKIENYLNKHFHFIPTNVVVRYYDLRDFVASLQINLTP